DCPRGGVGPRPAHSVTPEGGRFPDGRQECLPHANGRGADIPVCLLSGPAQSSSFSSNSRTRSRSACCCAVTEGYFGSRSRKVWTTMLATARRVNHLWSAGMTYHGARSVLVCASM